MADPETLPPINKDNLSNNIRMSLKPIVPPTMEFLLQEVYRCYKETVNALEQEIKDKLLFNEDKYKKNQKCSKCLDSAEFIEDLSAYYSQVLEQKQNYITHLEKQLLLQKTQSQKLRKINALYKADKYIFPVNKKRKKPLTTVKSEISASKIIKTYPTLISTSKSAMKIRFQEARKNENTKEQDTDLTQIKQYKQAFLTESPDLLNNQLLIQPKKSMEISLKKLELKDKTKEANLFTKLTTAKHALSKEMAAGQLKGLDKFSEKLDTKALLNKNHPNDTLISSSNNCYSGVGNKSKLISDTITKFHQIKDCYVTKQSIPDSNTVSQSTFDNCTERAAVDLKNERSSNQEFNSKFDGKLIKVFTLDKSIDEHCIGFNSLQTTKDEAITEGLPDKSSSEPKYKFRGETVRNKEERKKLNGFKCKMCEDYYKSIGLNESELKLRIKECSRHRDHYEAPSTPEDFWSIDFPNIEEYDNNGNAAADTQYLPLRSRRQRPLQ